MQLRTFCIFTAAFLVFTYIAILIGKPPTEKLDRGLSLHEFSKKNGYHIQSVTVQTEDGYLLTLHRIKCSKNQTTCKRKGPPVLILHGLLGSSADFVIARNQSLAFQLADKGYDVWLGNNRGNTFSREHIMLDPNEDKVFWDYSFHEMGVFDLAAMIDYIIQETNYRKITYVGMAQGSLNYLVLTSVKPEYNERIIISNLLAPMTTFYATKSIVLKFWSFLNFFIERALYYMGHFEVLGDNNIETRLLRYFCLGPHKLANYFCTEHILKYGYGLSDQKNYDSVPFHFSVSPAGASTKQFQHIIQNRISGKFAQYDYYESNNDIYKENSSPIYDVSKVTSPIAIYFGKADIFASIEGLYHQFKSLPNVVLRHKVPYDQFNHMDFIYAKDLNRLVNNKLMETIDLYNKQIKDY